MTLWFLLLFIGVTGLIMAMSVPIMRGRVKPNLIYGVRTTRTLSDENAWYRSNTYGGRLLFRTGFVQLVTVIALYCIPSLREHFVAYNLVCGAVVLGGVLLASARIMRFVQSL